MDNYILSIRDLEIHVSNRIITQNVSFDINHGEAILLSGENGVGKSTLLKTIMLLDLERKKIKGKILSANFGDLFSLSADKVQGFRRSVAYIAQKDEYAEMGNVSVADIINSSAEAYSGTNISNAEINDLIDEWIPRKQDNKRVFDAKSKPSKFSGGEQRLLSVLSIIATRPTVELMIVDEPLNNLDYVNARNISNILNKVRIDNPSMGLIMVSHCRIFPFITREIKLTSYGVDDLPNNYICHACFGNHDEQGFYI